VANLILIYVNLQTVGLIRSSNSCFLHLQRTLPVNRFYKPDLFIPFEGLWDNTGAGRYIEDLYTGNRYPITKRPLKTGFLILQAEHWHYKIEQTRDGKHCIAQYYLQYINTLLMFRKHITSRLKSNDIQRLIFCLIFHIQVWAERGNWTSTQIMNIYIN
jgi:hypothetical protein